MRILEKLPKLAILCLWRDSFEKGDLSLKFGPGTFPRLSRLEIDHLEDLNWVIFESTAMAKLEVLQVDYCISLDKGGFSGAHFLPKLKEVQVRGDYFDDFKETLQGQVTKATLIMD
jgi:hypothetical protein